MSRRDPGETTGHGIYPPAAPPCSNNGCGHMQANHEVIANHGRGQCRTGGLGGPCRCTRYQPGGVR